MFQEALNNNKMASALYQALFQWEPFGNNVTDWFDADWMFGIRVDLILLLQTRLILILKI